MQSCLYNAQVQSQQFQEISGNLKQIANNLVPYSQCIVPRTNYAAQQWKKNGGFKVVHAQIILKFMGHQCLPQYPKNSPKSSPFTLRKLIFLLKVLIIYFPTKHIGCCFLQDYPTRTTNTIKNLI
eukprot:TRINITY_DN4143_c0_g1_i1.p3 TRINITY_DN4143_c0_g1~~TRINITY_DN4143_c0_g1_i1.p3  ORF type:complete len:125 (+),score=1.09 TRINITY_DN4143_c0_g1_i1:424-798(+)